MQLVWKAALVLVWVVLASGVNTPAHAEPAATESQAITDNRALDAAYVQAFLARDADAMMRLHWHSPDLLVIFPEGNAVRGWENVRQAYRALFGKYEVLHAQVDDVSYRSAGDGVLGSGLGTVTFRPAGGAGSQQQRIRFTDFREKKDGHWVYVQSHLQVLPPKDPASAEPASATAAAPTLYRRLGGYDAIAALVDDFIPRLAADAQFKRFFGGISVNSARRLRQLFVDQLVAATGGPALYTGRDMKTVHTGLGISDGDWDRMVVLLTQSCDKLNVGPRERADLLALLTPLKPDIVEKK